MNRRRCLLLLAAALPLVSGCSHTGGGRTRVALHPERYPGTVKVACVGDSITFGAGVEDRDQNAYPVVLGKLLGPKCEVRNFGVSGATLLRNGDFSYWTRPQFQEVQQWAPDAIILKLGTNDTKPQNWKHGGEFRADLEAMLDRFAALPSHPKVWLCLPVPVYATRWGINEEVLRDQIIPILREVATARRIPVIDLHTALSDRPQFFPDQIHPNGPGAAMMAMAVSVALKGR